jgi:hypothetical protein
MKGFFASVQEARKILAKKEKTKIPLLKASTATSGIFVPDVHRIDET